MKKIVRTYASSDQFNQIVLKDEADRNPTQEAVESTQSLVDQIRTVGGLLKVFAINLKGTFVTHQDLQAKRMNGLELSAEFLLEESGL
jgi:ribosomal protein S8E